jgi:hypothetical protein
MTGFKASMSNFTGGFKGGLTVRGLPLAVAHPGKVFYVGDSNVAAFPNRKGASNNNDGSFNAPFSTIDYAVGQCLADRHDVIFVLPGYSETITGADAIDLDVDGISVIGLGTGDKQPTIVFNNTAATVGVDADNVTIENLHFAASLTGIVKGVDVKDGADDFRIANCRFSAEALTTDEFNDAIFVTTADRGVIENCYFDMDEAGAQSAVHLVGAILGCTVQDNYVTGDYAVACIESVTAAQEQVLINNNTLVNGAHSGLGTLACINLFTGTTGFIQNNRLYTNVASAVTAAIVADGCFISNNTITTTAETPHINAESLVNGLQMTSLTAVETNDEGEGEKFFLEGPVDVWGVFGVMSTGADETEELSLITESGVTLMALGEVHTATVAGDVFYAAEAGNTPTVAEVGATHDGTASLVWQNPVRFTGAEDAVDMLAEGDVDGGGAATIHVVWSAVTSSGDVTNTE